ncbi:MAG TPA: hypothetical protein VGH72_33690 [Pseudonocardia sp.]|jgi:hypothetical protein
MADYVVGTDTEETFAIVRAEMREATARAILAEHDDTWPTCGVHGVDLDLSEQCFVCQADAAEYRSAGLYGRI